MRNNKFRNTFHVGRLFPNMVTVLGLCAGLSSIRYGLYGKWETAVIFIIIAVLLDGVDGRLARMLNSTSNFGAQLDSLCDLVNFGIAPPLLIYLWKTNEIRGLGWAFVLFFSVCCALRLARFNISIDDDEPKKPWADRFFTGIPAPAGAGLCLMPLMIWFWQQENPQVRLPDFFTEPVALALYLGLIGVLMASRVPTFSIKKIKIKSEYLSLTLISIAMFIIALIIEPWLAFPLLGLVYLLTIPASVFYYYRMKTKASFTSGQASHND